MNNSNSSGSQTPVKLAAESLGKSFCLRGRDLVILREVNLCMHAGESAAILGPSGSGKSTLLNILGTLEAPTSGTVFLDGRNPFSLEERELARFRNQHIGFVFQEHHLLPQCTVLENVLLPTLASRQGGNSRAERARTLLAAVGLSDRLEHRPGELSGGERQRVAIARALINEPSVILADEPTGNLDRTSAEAVGNLLLEVVGSKAVLIVVTHSERLSQRFPRRYEIIEGVLTAL